MILTNCACCAAPLPHLAKQCSRCKTRYCGPACQIAHWKEGGHDKRCKNIRKGGGAEQHHADKKCKEAVAAAAEACAEDTKGQTCYICTPALHWKTKEGLVRGCACRGTAGFAHVSCLAEQAKILFTEAEENNLDDKINERFARWHTCSLCEQQYHGVVSCALGWACWKTYVGRSEGDQARRLAMTELASGLDDAKHHAEVLSVQEAQFSMMKRLGDSVGNILAVQGNLASTYYALNRLDETLHIERDVYFGYLKLSGEENERTLAAATNYVSTLKELKRFEEAKALLLKIIPVARRVLGESNDITLKMRWNFATVLYLDASATLDDLREAVTTLEDTVRIARRVLGAAHPTVVWIEDALRDARAALGAREASTPVSSICEAVEAMTTGEA